MRKIILGIVAAGTLAIVPLSSAGAVSSHSKSGYLSAIHKLAPATKQYTNAGMVKLGTSICADFNGGNTVQQEVVELLEANVSHHIMSNENLGVVLAASVHYFCPGFTAPLKAWLRQEESSSNSGGSLS